MPSNFRKDISSIFKESLIDEVKRYGVLFFGLSLMVFGIAFAVKAGLGNTAISSLPYSFSIIIPQLSMGSVTVLIYGIFIMLQIFLLKEEFQRIQLLQLPIAFLFGGMIDGAMWALEGLTISAQWEAWLALALGISLLGIGVRFQLAAKAVMLPADGLVAALAYKLNVEFSMVKIAFDAGQVALAIVLGMIFLGIPAGIGAGSLFAVIFVGKISGWVKEPVELLALAFLESESILELFAIVQIESTRSE